MEINSSSEKFNLPGKIRQNGAFPKSCFFRFSIVSYLIISDSNPRCAQPIAFPSLKFRFSAIFCNTSIAFFIDRNLFSFGFKSSKNNVCAPIEVFCSSKSKNDSGL